MNSNNESFLYTTQRREEGKKRRTTRTDELKSLTVSMWMVTFLKYFHFSWAFLPLGLHLPASQTWCVSRALQGGSGKRRNPCQTPPMCGTLGWVLCAHSQLIHRVMANVITLTFTDEERESERFRERHKVTQPGSYRAKIEAQLSCQWLWNLDSLHSVTLPLLVIWLSQVRKEGWKFSGLLCLLFILPVVVAVQTLLRPLCSHENIPLTEIINHHCDQLKQIKYVLFMNS